MELTESWRAQLPPSVVERYDVIETGDAAAAFTASDPELLAELAAVLDGFHVDVERIVRGDSGHFISEELDEAFRAAGWREIAGDGEGAHTPRVKGRVGLDVEWDLDDGRLGRDLSIFRDLHDAGSLDLGILIVRREAKVRALWCDTIARAKELRSANELHSVNELHRANVFSAMWGDRLDNTPDDPLEPSSTSTFESLVARIRRGEGGGCPLLVIAVTTRCCVLPVDLDSEIERVAHNHTVGGHVERLAQRLFPAARGGELLTTSALA